MRFFSVVCLSIYYEKNTAKTALTMMRLFFAKELNFCPSDINVSCVKMPVFETHFKIFNSCFLYVQQVVTRNKLISYRPCKLMTLNFLTVKENLCTNLLRTIISSLVNKNFYYIVMLFLCYASLFFCISRGTLKYF